MQFLEECVWTVVKYSFFFFCANIPFKRKLLSKNQLSYETARTFYEQCGFRTAQCILWTGVMDWSLGLVSWDGVLEWILELNFESRNRKTHFWWYTVRLG